VDLVYRVLQSGSFGRHLPVNFLRAYRFNRFLRQLFVEVVLVEYVSNSVAHYKSRLLAE
jgi:hypothetical protein